MTFPGLRCSSLCNWACRGLLILAVVSLAGCSTLAVSLGWRVRLDREAVTSVSASLVNQRDRAAVGALGPGQSAQLVIVAKGPAGQEFVTVGAGHGKVAFSNYAISADLVQVAKNGKVSMPADPRVTEGKVARLSITPLGHPDVVTEFNIPVRYDIAFVANFSGADGTPGFDGSDGLDGSAGTDGTPPTVDPTTGSAGTPGPGGSGSAGGNGGDGSNGQDGSRGGMVHIWIRLASGATPLLHVKAISGTKQSLFIVDPNGGSLEVLANGGRGGRGGLRRPWRPRRSGWLGVPERVERLRRSRGF